jgi:hypothetical protein
VAQVQVLKAKMLEMVEVHFLRLVQAVADILATAQA